MQTTWENIVGALMAVQQQCLKLRKQPGWADVEGAAGRKAAIAMLMPKDSEAAQDWAIDDEFRVHLVGERPVNVTNTS